MWQPRFSQHSSNALNQCLVHPFDDTILLSSLQHSQFMTNSFLLQVCLKLYRQVLTTVVEAATIEINLLIVEVQMGMIYIKKHLWRQ